MSRAKNIQFLVRGAVGLLTTYQMVLIMCENGYHGEQHVVKKLTILGNVQISPAYDKHNYNNI